MSGVFAKNLRRFMDEEGASAPALADWAGMHHNTIYNWLAGGLPSAANLNKVAQVLRRPMDDFFKEEGHVGDEKY